MKLGKLPLLLLACGCGCSARLPEGGETTTFNGSIAGRLIVLPDTGPELILEQELNDGVDQTQFVGRLSGGDEVTILGDLSVPAGDALDAFEFVAEVPLLIELTLTVGNAGEDVAPDLDVAVHDFESFLCSPQGIGDSTFALCFDSEDAVENGVFPIDGSFVVVVTAAAATADYQLDLATNLIGEPESIPVSAAGAAKTAPHWPSVSPPGASESDEFLCGELIVRFENGLDRAAEDRLLARAALSRVESSPSGITRVAVRLSDPSNRSLARDETLLALERAQRLPGVRFAEVNSLRQLTRVPNDKYFNLQWHYDVINVAEAWDMTVGSDEVIVAVIDSGIVSGHPDLDGRLAAGYDFISDPDRARDGDGRDPDPEDPGDLQGGAGLSSFHGTHVAGIIGAATNNARGVSGVTWQAKIMPLRAVGNGGLGTAFDSSEAIRFAAGLPNASGTLPERSAQVINMSFGAPAGRAGSQCEAAAVQDATEAGLVIVASAGNSGTTQPSFPAALPEVIGVSAVDIQLQRAAYSNFGSWIGLAAPGGATGTDINGDSFPDGVLSTAARDLRGVIDLRYDFSIGTSMAAPHVAGVAALVIAANPALGPADIRDVLEMSALDLGVPGRDNDFGYGLVDAAASVREARRRAGIDIDTPPELFLSPDSLDFGTARNELRVRILNVGGGFLDITSIDVDEIEGVGWLRARTRGSTAGNVSADELLVSVNRSGQDEALLRGAVSVWGNGTDSAVVNVAAVVGEAPLFQETIFVTASRRGGPELTVQTSTSAEEDFAYEFTNMPAGEYIVTAGTDRNGDGDPCGPGDLCGAFPSMIARSVIVLEDGDSVANIDFSVSRRLLRRVRIDPSASQQRRGLTH